MSKRREGHIFESLGGFVIERFGGIDRIGFDVPALMPRRHHAILRLVMIDYHRLGVEAEQVDDRRAKETQIVFVETLIRRICMLQHNFELEARRAHRKHVDVEPAKIDEQKLLAEREIFEQQLIARKCSIRLRPQPFFRREPCWFDAHAFARQGLAVTNLGDAPFDGVDLTGQRKVHGKRRRLIRAQV